MYFLVFLQWHLWKIWPYLFTYTFSITFIFFIFFKTEMSVFSQHVTGKPCLGRPLVNLDSRSKSCMKKRKCFILNKADLAKCKAWLLYMRWAWVVSPPLFQRFEIPTLLHQRFQSGPDGFWLVSRVATRVSGVGSPLLFLYKGELTF